MQLDNIIEFLKKPIEQLEYELVEVNILGSKNPTLQILIERKDRKNIALKDCEKLAARWAHWLMWENFIRSIYIRNFISWCRKKTE